MLLSLAELLTTRFPQPLPFLVPFAASGQSVLGLELLLGVGTQQVPGYLWLTGSAPWPAWKPAPSRL